MITRFLLLGCFKPSGIICWNILASSHLISGAGHLESTCRGVAGSWNLGIKCTFTTAVSLAGVISSPLHKHFFPASHLVFLARIVQAVVSTAQEPCTITCDWVGWVKAGRIFAPPLLCNNTIRRWPPRQRARGELILLASDFKGY